MSQESIYTALKQEVGEIADTLNQDSQLHIEVNKMVAEKCDPYVPYITGQLAHNITIDSDGITYNQPYAEKVYNSTGLHNLEKHPLASSRWDEVAFANHRDEIEERASEIVRDKLKEIQNG